MLIFLFFTLYSFSQKNTTCIYKVKKNETLKNDKDKSANSVYINKLLNDALNKMNELEYKLIYNNKESVFKLIPKITNGPEKEHNFVKLAEAIAGSGVYYQNLSENISIHQHNVYGEDFLVNDSLDQGWVLTNESKKIGQFTCYKAINKCKSCSKSNFIEVWYTPQIPVHFGPRGFGGLPGLILEIKMKTITIYLDKIIKNSEDIIERPTKGKSLTLQQYKKMSAKMRPTN